tara:strand:+ start:358 stop:762 length:405 start_codon:yes stop_codon:yes gene_type:complete
MSDFENKLIDLIDVESSALDVTSFLTKLRGRHINETIHRKRAVSGLTAFLFVLLIGVFTSYQLNSTVDQTLYWSEIGTANYFDTDFSNIDDDEDTLSIEEFTLFLIQENNVWDTEDLIYLNELYENTNEYEVSL